MDSILERIISCIGQKHGSSKALADYLGIHPNVITNWKNGRNRSYRGYLKEIANYFNVTVDYLLTGEQSDQQQKKAPAKTVADDVGILLDEIQDKLKSGEDIMFNGYRLSPESAAALAASIEAVDAMTAKLTEQTKDKNRR